MVEIKGDYNELHSAIESQKSIQKKNKKNDEKKFVIFSGVQR